MTLEEKTVEEMKRNPCIFRQGYYNNYCKESGFQCTLTATRITGHDPQFEKCCRPEKCPIWKTYVMLLCAEQEKK